MVPLVRVMPALVRPPASVPAWVRVVPARVITGETRLAEAVRPSPPAATVVGPVKPWAPVSVSVPAPSLVRPPGPETVPAKVTASARLNARVPALATSPTRLPAVPPSPTWRVPAAMVVPPV
ncbi:hypothetical protein MEME101129_28870 [Methylobacterium mesophilicum]